MNKTINLTKRKIRFKDSLKNKYLYLEVVMGLVLITFVALPLLRMLFSIDKESFSRVFSGNQFTKALINSITTTLVSTIVSVIIAYFLAWSISRTGIKGKGLFCVIFTLPMLIPSISHGMGLVILFGNNGIFTRLFNTSSSLYGFGGIVMGSVLYSFPIAFLMFLDILKYQDCSTYDAAEILGIPKHRQFASITFPYIRKPLISIVFTIFTMIITDYGIPLSVGGKMKTLSVLLYENAVGQLDYSAGAIIGMFLLIPATIAFLFDLFNKDKSKPSFITYENSDKNNKVKISIGYTISIVISVCVTFIIGSFCIQAFSKSYPNDLSFTLAHFKKIFIQNGFKYLDNSIFMSLYTAFIGMVLSFVVAYFTARIKTKFSKLLHIISIISIAVPGMVLGLSYVITFKTSFIYGTIIILILVNTVHFFSSPYLMMYNALSKINGNLETIGLVLNIPRKYIIFDVIIPQCKNTLLEVFSYFFVNSMMTISAVSFLVARGNKPLSLMINQFETFNMMECAAVVAIMILIVNILMKVIIYLIKKLGEKNVNKKSI